MSIDTKFGRIVTYCKRLSTLKSHDSSSNIVEVIRAVLNVLFLFFIFFFIFFMIRFHKHKKAQIRLQRTKIKKFVWKTFKRKKVTYSLFAFYAFT